MPVARFTWELRVDRLPVLYTHQKATQRRVLREGSLRLAAGLAVLLDAENRALDEQTVTVALLDQLERGEEIDFPGHLVKPEAAVALGFARAGSPGKAAPALTPPPRTPSPRAQRLRQPFKRPRTATPDPPPPVCAPSPSPARASRLGPTTVRAPTARSSLDLWEGAMEEEVEDRPMQTRDLWEGAERDLQSELRRESFRDSPTASSRSQPVPTPCRSNVSPGSQEGRFRPNPAVLAEPAPSAIFVAEQEPAASRLVREEGPCVGLPKHVGPSASMVFAPPPSAASDEAPQEPAAPRLVREEGPCVGLPKQACVSPQRSTGEPEESCLEDPDGSGDAQEDADAEQGDEVSQDDLPILEVVGKAPRPPTRTPKKASSSRGQAQGTKTQTKLPPSMRLPLSFDAHASTPALTSGAEYCAYFEHALLTEMQRRLGQLSSAWKRSAQEGDLSVAVKGARIGRAKEDPDAVALILGRTPSVLQGDVKACAKNDLWIILIKGSAPLLLRSVWKGVNPSGRVLCVAVNEAAATWLEACSSRLTTVTALASGAFSSELLQVEALRSLRSESGGSGGDHGFARLLRALPVASPQHEVEPAPLPEAAEAPELASLSAEQRKVAGRLASWVSRPGPSGGTPVLVRGVFGSGKSRTLAACIVSLDRLLRATRDPRRILLVCQTNVAVDGVLHHLLSQFGWDDFSRLGSFRSVDPVLLYRTVSLMASRTAAAKELSEALQRRPPEVREALQSAIDRGLLPPKPAAWRRRRLVAVTTAALEAADLGQEALHCPFVLVDEASQLTEPAVFYALYKARAEQVMLVGDPRQLPPRALHAPLQQSALERLWNPEVAICLELATQFRCHPAIASLCSQLFYNGALQSGVTAEERTSGLGPMAAPLAVVLSEGPETRVGQSFRHDTEVQLCAAWLKRAAGCGRLQPKDFGIICLYRPHAEACARSARGVSKDVEVATVDAFQGGEREAVALCCGRSTPVGTGDPFACCPRRLNVALSRARRHLVIFGTESFLSQHPVLSRVLAAAASHGAVHRAADVEA